MGEEVVDAGVSGGVVETSNNVFVGPVSWNNIWAGGRRAKRKSGRENIKEMEPYASEGDG